MVLALRCGVTMFDCKGCAFLLPLWPDGVLFWRLSSWSGAFTAGAASEARPLSRSCADHATHPTVHGFLICLHHAA